ncbi:MAG: T9SS type A sorting domain-containing protein, partial [Bacteroidota bacterium]
IENEVYTLELTDETASVVKFLVDADIIPNELYYLSQVAEKFLHVEIDIDNIIELATISFDGFSMSNQSFFYDEVSGEFVGFDKVAVDDPFSAFLIPQIGGISPNPVPAGTRLDEHILVITKTEEPGNGFGDHNNPDGTFNQNCTECRVRFVDSDNPFGASGYVYARGADIISWTDDEIRLNVPSTTAINGFYQHSAASGGMRVESPTGNSSEVDIHIPYSVLNYQSSPSIVNPTRRFASALQTENGIVFNYHEDVIGGKKVEADRAFSKWCETTDIGWVISDQILTDEDVSGLISGTDNRNIISVQPDGEFEDPAARAAVRITGHFAFCPPSAVAYIRDVDVLLKDTPFQNDEADRWYNFVLHELGHAHLLYHSINPDGGTLQEHIMYYDLTNINNLGDPQMGILHRHPIQASDKDGAETIFSSSANLLSTCNPSITPIDNIGCMGTNSTNNIPEHFADVKVYPNPSAGEKLYLSLSLDTRTDFVIDILTITGQTITSEQYVSGQVGQNLIELHNLQVLPKGSYLVRVSSESNSFLVKFVQL